MRFRKKDDWDDDWDDEEVPVPQKRPPIVTTQRIFWSLAVVAAVILVFGGLGSRDQFELDEVPQPLLGAWACGDPARSDQWVEFRREDVLMSTSTTGSARYKVAGVDREQAAGSDRYTVYYSDMAGKKQTMEIWMMSSGAIRFVDDPAIEWTRFDE